MAVTPTRFLNKNSDLSDMTIDQFYLIHGKTPVVKDVPRREMGFPKGKDQITAISRAPQENPDNVPYLPHGLPQGLQGYALRSAELIVEAKKKQGQRQQRQPASYPAKPGVFYPSESAPALPSAPPPNPIPGFRPTPGQAHILVAPTPNIIPEPSEQEPCAEVMELVFEVVGVGMVAYPLQCEVLGRHPNQPHMIRVFGRLQTPDRPESSLPAQDVFVGWDDAIFDP